MKTIIEHRIKKEKDYLPPLVFGSLWTAIVFAINYGMYLLVTQQYPQETYKIITAVTGTLLFCWALWVGRDMFKATEIETVEHEIRRVK